jgi:hypothetical protein
MRWGVKWTQRTRRWEASDWHEFNQNLFNVSKFMQHVNGEFAKWFNRTFEVLGPFWADRFKNPELIERQSLQDCIVYVELNAIRAHLVERPEDWEKGSACWRCAGQKESLLIPLEEIFPPEPGMDSFQTYRSLLYYRGAVARKESEGTIPEAILRREEQRGIVRPGVFAQRLRGFTEGVAIGSPQKLRELLAKYIETGLYLRRRHPIPHLNGLFFTLREQRSHALLERTSSTGKSNATHLPSANPNPAYSRVVQL